MAPLAPTGRDGALARIAKKQLPIWLGSPHPCAVILEQEGRFRIRDLVIDEEEARRKGAEALARGESWMPEHYFGLGRPVGQVHAEAESLEALAAQIKTMRWPAHW